MDHTTVAARIAALVKKYAQPSAKLPDLDREVAEIAAYAVAAAEGFSHSVAAPVVLEWFKLANRAEIKLTAESTQSLALGLVAKRGQRVVLIFADPDKAIGSLPPTLPVNQAQQTDLVEQAEKLPPKKFDPDPTPTRYPTLPPHDPVTGELIEEKASQQPQTVSEGVPDLPPQLDRRKKKATPKKVEPKPEPQQAAVPDVAEPWISSVDEPDSYDPNDRPSMN